MSKGDKPTLFSRLGGVETVRAVVNEFYTRILADDQLKRFFDQASMTALRLHQLEFMKLAFTEIPDDVDPVALLTEKHQRLFREGLNGEHFDLVAQHFVGALQHHRVDQILIDEAATVIMSFRPTFLAGAEKYGPSANVAIDSNLEKNEERPVLHANQDKEPTLMDKLGGVAALKTAVEEFYKRILSDPELAIFFENTSMTALKMHQLAFMKIAFTQIPDDLDVPKLMKEKHAPLFEKGLNASHFDKVASHFANTLKHLNVASDLVDECVSVIAPLRVVFE